MAPISMDRNNNNNDDNNIISSESTQHPNNNNNNNNNNHPEKKITAKKIKKRSRKGNTTTTTTTSNNNNQSRLRSKRKGVPKNNSDDEGGAPPLQQRTRIKNQDNTKIIPSMKSPIHHPAFGLLHHHRPTHRKLKAKKKRKRHPEDIISSSSSSSVTSSSSSSSSSLSHRNKLPQHTSKTRLKRSKKRKITTSSSKTDENNTSLVVPKHTTTESKPKQPKKRKRRSVVKATTTTRGATTTTVPETTTTPATPKVVLDSTNQLVGNDKEGYSSSSSSSFNKKKKRKKLLYKRKKVPSPRSSSSSTLTSPRERMRTPSSLSTKQRKNVSKQHHDNQKKKEKKKRKRKERPHILSKENVAPIVWIHTETTTTSSEKNSIRDKANSIMEETAAAAETTDLDLRTTTTTTTTTTPTTIPKRKVHPQVLSKENSIPVTVHENTTSSSEKKSILDTANMEEAAAATAAAAAETTDLDFHTSTTTTPTPPKTNISTTVTTHSNGSTTEQNPNETLEEEEEEKNDTTIRSVTKHTVFTKPDRRIPSTEEDDTSLHFAAATAAAAAAAVQVTQNIKDDIPNTVVDAWSSSSSLLLSSSLLSSMNATSPQEDRTESISNLLSNNNNNNNEKVDTTTWKETNNVTTTVETMNSWTVPDKDAGQMQNSSMTLLESNTEKGDDRIEYEPNLLLDGQQQDRTVVTSSLIEKHEVSVNEQYPKDMEQTHVPSLKEEEPQNETVIAEDDPMQRYQPTLLEYNKAGTIGVSSENAMEANGGHDVMAPVKEWKAVVGEHNNVDVSMMEEEEDIINPDQDVVSFVSNVLNENVSSWVTDVDSFSEILGNKTRGGHGSSFSAIPIILAKDGDTTTTAAAAAFDSADNIEKADDIKNVPCTTSWDRKSLEAEGDKESDITISVVTWNLAEESPPEDDASFIRKFRSNGIKPGSGSELVFISAQECENIKPRRSEGRRSREFRRLMIMMLGKEYIPIAMHLLGGIQFALFARRSFLKEIDDVAIADVTCGIGNVFHNKGAIAAFLTVKARNNEGGNLNAKTKRSKFCRMVFVAAHMAAHVKNSDARDADFWRISSELESAAPEGFLPKKKPGSYNGSFLFDSVDRVFFCGDLNYRLDLPRELTEYCVVSGDGEESISLFDLLRHDQLIHSITEGKAFAGFVEGKIKFAPTFKLDKETGVYDSSHKQRIPAWTDRILFRPSSDIRVQEYSSVPESQHSDHRPVYGSFRVNIEGRELPASQPNKKRKRKTEGSSGSATKSRQRQP